MPNSAHKFCVAPMMDWTDRHCRYFHRQLSTHARLYTEMLTADAVLHGDQDRLLGFHDLEHPLALQLGGCEPATLAPAAEVATERGYDEINLNVGCPSSRVQQGRFGACLMREPDGVAQCVHAMRARTNVPVTVKCRIGIDNDDSEEHFSRFIDTVADGGCEVFIVHARKAWLEGLSPKQNRELPPLDYERVYRLKARRPDLTIIINGGIETLDDATCHLQRVDGVMLGRAAYQNPFLLSGVDTRFFASERSPPTRAKALRSMIPYAEQHVAAGGRLNNIARHMLGLYHGQPRARAYRRHLSQLACNENAGADVLNQALAIVERQSGSDHAVAAE